MAEETKNIDEEYDSTKMDPKEEIWEGGPNFAQINSWKEEFGSIYVTSLTPEVHYVWRCLTRPEYRMLVKELGQAMTRGTSEVEGNMDNEERIAELCILAPSFARKDPKQLAGVAPTVSAHVMEASGFVPVDIREL